MIAACGTMFGLSRIRHGQCLARAISYARQTQWDLVCPVPKVYKDIDFNADQRGLSLFHCHMQLHMDFGFMALFDCA